MKNTRRLLISFEPVFANVDMVRAAVWGICIDFFQLPINAASIMDFCLIVTELMNNTLEHANAKEFHAELLLSEHEALFRLIYDGDLFDPTAAATPVSRNQDADFPESGYSLALILALADGTEYERLESSNRVSLRKTFPATSEIER